MLAQVRLESVQCVLEVLGVTLLLGNQLEFLLFSGFDAQLQAFESMFNTGQSCLYTVSLTEQHNGINTLGGQETRQN